MPVGTVLFLCDPGYDSAEPVCEEDGSRLVRISYTVTEPEEEPQNY
ncbi:MAG: hypothetical protein K6E50_06975 [Lachnospiraceae bacterium]|nr:hypothetical protein [Lachnospiraceae bacterium]